jgi:exopolysaccharide biosynthesis polyprenyl glycosylphosphotransferase
MLRRHRQLRAQLHQLIDAGLFVVALGLAHFWRSHWKISILGGNPEIESFDQYLQITVLIFFLSPLVLRTQGFYSRPLLSSRSDTAWTLLKSCAIITITVILAIFLFRAQHWIARSVVILFGFVGFALVFLKEELVRWAVQSDFGRSQMKKRLILVGAPDETARLRSELKNSSHEGMEIILELDLQTTPVERLVEYLHEHSVNAVILSARHTEFGQVEKTIQACELEGVEAWLVADFFKTQICRTSLDDFHGHPVLVFRSAPEDSWQAVAKLVFDFIGSLCFLVFFSWIYVLIAILIKLTSPGPIFFRQQRSGLNGHPFVMYKFRSMVTDAEQRQHELAVLNEMSGPVFKVTNDPRITKIGRFLRRTSLDELPQMFNVLCGNMSIVGPRPLPVHEVKRFDDLAHRRRLSVKPGLTCLWQISGRNQINDFKDWVRLDLEYIDNWSLWLDFKILWRTVPVVLLAKGAK